MSVCLTVNGVAEKNVIESLCYKLTDDAFNRLQLFSGIILYCVEEPSEA